MRDQYWMEQATLAACWQPHAPEALQDLRAPAGRSPRWPLSLDRMAPVQRGPGTDEQQNQAGQPSRLRLPQAPALHQRHLPLLRPAATTRLQVITLSGEEPKVFLHRQLTDLALQFRHPLQFRQGTCHTPSAESGERQLTPCVPLTPPPLQQLTAQRGSNGVVCLQPIA